MICRIGSVHVLRNSTESSNSRRFRRGLLVPHW